MRRRASFRLRVNVGKSHIENRLFDKVMIGEILEPSVRSELPAQHKRGRDGRACDRIKVVLLRDDGRTYSAIASALLLSEEGGRVQLNDYETRGKLSPENGGSSS